MSTWFRVFGRSDAAVEPAALLAHLHAQGLSVAGHFRGDDRGWFRAELAFADEEAPVIVARYLADEEGIRGELNSWAAWLEEQETNPQAVPLMERLIVTKQLFTLHQPDEDADPDDAAAVERLCLTCCRYLAAVTDAVYQADHHGFCAVDGTLLVAE